MGGTHSEALSKFFVATQSNTQIVARPPHVCGSHGTMIINLWYWLCQVAGSHWCTILFQFAKLFWEPTHEILLLFVGCAHKGKILGIHVTFGMQFWFQPVLANYWENTWLSTRVLIICQLVFNLKQKWKITYPPCTFHSKNQQDPYGLGIEISKFNDFTWVIGISSK